MLMFLRHRLRRPFGLCVVLALSASVWVSAARPAAKKTRTKFDEAVARIVPDERNVRVIVTSEQGRSDDVTETLARKSHRVVAKHSSIDSITVELPAAALSELASEPAIKRISLDAEVVSFLDEVGTLSTNMLLPTLGLPSHGYTGAGVGVAVLDTGIISHSEIAVAAFYDFVNGGKATKPTDPFGHGTHVAGMIEDKQGKSDARYRSVAKGARLIGLRVLDGSGIGYTSTVIQAIEFAIANKTTLGIDVLNLSLGHPVYESAATDPLVRAVERAVAAGIVVVVSAGNEGLNRQTGAGGYGGVKSPGNAPSAITVGAVDTRNTITRTDDQIPHSVLAGRRGTTPTPSLTWSRRDIGSYRSWRRTAPCRTNIQPTEWTWLPART